MKDYYKILGINKNASLDDIKMAYKKLAMKYHPDRNPNNPKSEERFKEVKEAYEFLTNKNPSTPSFDFNSENINFTDFTNAESSLDDIFNVIFQKSYKKDNKIYFLLDIDLESSFYGSTIDIKIPYKGYCDICFGKGSKPGTDMKICPKCYGAGMYNMMQGIFSFRQKCYKCNGKGYVFVEYCNFCSGSGKVNKYINHTLFIDKNSDNNTLISLKNLKCKGFNFDNYFILLKVKKHPFFFRKNKTNDLYINYYLDFIKSIFGGYIKVPTLYGCVLYKINKFNQFGKIYKLNSFGLNYKKKNGDLYFVLIVEIISNLNYYQWLLFNKIKIHLDYDFNYFYFLKNNLKINSFYKLILSF